MDNSAATRSSFAKTLKKRSVEGAKASWANIIIPQGLKLLRSVIVSVVDAVVLGEMPGKQQAGTAIGRAGAQTPYDAISTAAVAGATSLYASARATEAKAKSDQLKSVGVPYYATRGQAEEILETLSYLAEENGYVTVADMLSMSQNAKGCPEPTWVDQGFGWSRASLSAFKIVSTTTPFVGYRFVFPAPRAVENFK